MSLINDALKRAGQTPPPPPIPPPMPVGDPAAIVPPPPIVAPPRRPASPAKATPAWALVVLPLGLLLVLGAGVWFLWQGMALKQREEAMRNPKEVNAREVQPTDGEEPASPPLKMPPTIPAAIEAPQPAAPPVAPASPPVPPTAPARSSATPAVSVSAPPAEAPKPAFPKLKLQGIFYRPSNPSAMINSKMIYIGETIQEARVLAIDRNSVTLEFAGQTNLLNMH